MEQEYKIPDGVRARVAKEFLEAIDDAVLPFQVGQLDLFTDEEETYVRQEVERMLFEPKLPNAGSQEKRWIKKLSEYADDENLVMEIRGFCRETATAFQNLLPRQDYIRRGDETITLPGCYYVRKAITPKGAKTRWKACIELRQEAIENKEWGLKWLADFLLQGLPEAVSNFKMECLYLLRGHDGNVARLVRLVNWRGEVSVGPEIGGTDILPNEMYAGPEKFREWCSKKGNFDFGVGNGGGTVELQMLRADISELAAWKVVRLVQSVGWFPLPADPKPNGLCPGMWFMDECVYHDGKCVMPNKEGIYTIEENNYVLASRGREEQFQHGRPAMHPEITVDDLMDLETHDWQEPNPEKDRMLAAFFREVCHRFYETAGGHAGWVIVGSVLGYAAAPELFKRNKNFPGLWMPGEMGSGKTSCASWAMALQGMNAESGLGLISKNCSPMGIMAQLENYSNIMAWLDNFRQAEVGEDKRSIIHDTYNRQPAAKITFGQVQRTIRTAPLVSGESTSSDPATRSRFPHVLISKYKRLGEHMTWFEAHRRYLFIFFRTLLERRAEFVKLVMDLMDKWMAEDMKVPQREKVSHAVSYASFCAAAALFESHHLRETIEFKNAVVEMCRATASDVSSDIHVNVFMQEVITAYKAGMIPDEYFYTEVTRRQLEGMENQGEWESVTLWFDVDMIFSCLEKFLTTRRRTLGLKQKDIRDQLGRHDFWAGAKNCRYKSGTAWSWGIKLDLHPFGLQRVSDEVFEEARSKQHMLAPNLAPVFLNGDPRKGPLFTIADGHRAWRSEQRRTSE